MKIFAKRAADTEPGTKRRRCTTLAAVVTLAMVALMAAGASDARAEEEADGDGYRGRIDPVSAPVTFESPFVHTSVRPFFLWHEFPETSIFGGGNLREHAVQARFALSDRMALIATKDGYADLNPDGGSDEEGWLDIAGGFKYSLVKPEDLEDLELTVTPGIIYEMTNGSRDVFQGNGEGVWRPFISSALGLGDFLLMGSFGADIPVDDDAESTSVDYHAHLSWEVSDLFVPLVEVNGITYVKDGDRLPVNFEAVDYGNLGSTMVDGNTIITGAIGTRVRFSEHIHFGATYEAPLTNRKDIFDERWTVDLQFKF